MYITITDFSGASEVSTCKIPDRESIQMRENQDEINSFLAILSNRYLPKCDWCNRLHAYSNSVIRH